MSIPVSVITGFLGSGKTTLLSRLLRHPDLSETAVVINEFGEVGLDHLLVEASEDSIVELGTGCLCCTIRDDLALTLGDLLARRDRGEIPQFRRVVIETSGLADPAPILHVLMADAALAERLSLDTVITTIDAVNGLLTLDEHVEAVKQAAVADTLLITKCDLAAAEADRLEARLRALNLAAEIHSVAHGDLAPDRLFSRTAYSTAGRPVEVGRWLEEERRQEAARHVDGSHGHDVNRHDDRIRAFCLERDEPVSAVAFSLFLETLAEHCGPDLLRVKGIVEIAENPGRPAVIHGVQHVFHPPEWLDAWPGQDRKTRFVFITRDIPERWVATLLELLDDEARETSARLARRGPTKQEKSLER